jgi:serine/threonine-protein kinase PknG
VSVVKCKQPGCTGTIEDGYCDVCGTPADAPVAASSGSASSGSASSGSASLGSSPLGSSRMTSSNRLASAPIGSARTGGTRVTRNLAGTNRLRGARLGAGLTTVPPVPRIDPEKALLVNPQVAEDRRYCPSCGTAVGRGRDGVAGRTEGFCPQCRNPFSFAPKLTAGVVVAGQYEVAGCLAHGGLGWIYLARDTVLSGRWVVLKGLLNAGDADAYAAAVAERQFLAEVEHPLIVEIFNFVQHDGAGYIVMEYVGGTSLKGILQQRMKAAGGRYDPIPVDQALAYLIEIMPAFSYLHDKGLVYCDFKPDNLIQVGDAVKLIDMGGVRRIDDVDSAIYGTVGYQAPEVATVGPSVASDIFTLGRTLAVLVFEFRGYQTTYVTSFPPVVDVPVFQKHDALYRLLAKCCAPDPADRFATVDELRVQLLGVLREIVAERAGDAAAAHSAPSLLFEPPVVSGDTLDWRSLPQLRRDAGDAMATTLAGMSVDDPVARLAQLAKVTSPTTEVRLDYIRTALEAGRRELAEGGIADLLRDDPWEWRAAWLSGLTALDADDVTAARSYFNAVYGQVPGELAPKLALASACERSGEVDLAEGFYLTCAHTDAAYVAPAAFGLARVRSTRGDLDGALAALDLVPATNRGYVEARRQRAGMLAASGRGLPGLSAALSSLDGVTIDPLDRARLEANVLDVALRAVVATGADPSVSIGGVAAKEGPLRERLESAYRRLATMADDTDERIRLVDAANTVRRWTWR